MKIQWELKQKDFIEGINLFYVQIDSLLTPIKNKGLLSIDFAEHWISEEYIGKYKTQKMIIIFQDQNVTLVPVGTNILGAFGRIDMQGLGGEVKFLWVAKNTAQHIINSFKNSNTKSKSEINPLVPPEERVWKIATPPPHINFIELNEDSFSDALLGVIYD
jgi:hypothetical protein